MQSLRIGVDIGGTFTDVVALGDRGEVITRKVPSTPEDYSRGIAEGIAALLAELGAPPQAVKGVVHATTVATNTILEGKGALTALVTTEGFGDVLEMRRLRIPVLYDLQYRKPAPLAPRHLRFEVGERLAADGSVRAPLNPAEVERIAAALDAAGVEAVAVSFLHAYANPEHEAAAERILREHLDERIYISRSSAILPEIREYERTSTAVVNAYVGPVVQRYLRSLAGRLSALGISCPLDLMHSAGGITRIEVAEQRPAYLVESGPAAGVIACARVARAVREQNVISFDMGGTTAKAAIIEQGEPARTTEYEVGAGINLSSRLVKGGGYPIKLPFIDVSEIGAGGGSLIRVDEHGRVTVGPESAGAYPGPVCYGFGGTGATLCDALVTLGYINPARLVGGALPIDAEAARVAVETQVARPMGMPVLEAAAGVMTLAVATMTRAVKAVSTYRGRDPRDFTLVAFGGNGPVVAAEIARALNMSKILIPPAAGVFSALGLLYSDVEQSRSRTVMARADELPGDALERTCAELESEVLAEMVHQGYPATQVSLLRQADVRYAGQAYELTVDIPTPCPGFATLAEIFAAEHERTYGHRSATDPVELVNLRINARCPAGASPARFGDGEGPPGDSRRPVYFSGTGLVDTPVIGRGALAGVWREGPLVVEEYDTNCVVPPGLRATLDRLGNIEIDARGSL